MTRCSFCLLCVLVGYVLFRSCRYLIALILCSVGWLDSEGMRISVLVGFLYISKFRELFSFFILMSRKFSWLFSCLSMVKYIYICCAFVGTVNKLYKTHATNIKITHSNYLITQHNQNSHDNRMRGHKPLSRCVRSTMSPLPVDCITGLDLISSFLCPPPPRKALYFLCVIK